ncbi:hypothetical protein Acr_17g0012060 [Actinidia rufa]|uniref:Uncharacterized protein n=1 Tax=Actinidia rufa TaxID=165716 RepID=A0A7J0G4A5_9ERIC|nr:hypothetical protein Acr_17g0012060 [Actinidia rufa]
MAYNSKPVLGFLILSTILLAIVGHTLAGRKTPKTSENTFIKQPQTFIRGNGSVLVPGLAVTCSPERSLKGSTPFTHNPNTGTSGGAGSVGGTRGSSSGSGGREPHNSVPGGDDTFVPNPGVEVPNQDQKV